MKKILRFFASLIFLFYGGYASACLYSLSTNQVGYFQYASKSVELWADWPLADCTSEANLFFELDVYDVNGDVVWRSSRYTIKELENAGGHPEALTGASKRDWGNLFHYRWDFSGFEKTGSDFAIYIEGFTARTGGTYAGDTLAMSWPFMVHHSYTNSGPTPLANKYNSLALDAFKYYDFHRIGTPAMTGTPYTRQSLHGTAVPCFKDWCGKGVTLGKGTGWADAGDFGLYPVNHAMAAWQLLNAVEFRYKFFGNALNSAPVANDPDGPTKIRGSNQPLVDEVAIGSDYMLNLLPPNGQLAPHRITDLDWGQGFAEWCITGTCKTVEANVKPGNDYIYSSGTTPERVKSYHVRSASPPSTAATYAVCRTSAHLARLLYQDSTKQTPAYKWFQNARAAYQAAATNPIRFWPSYYSNDWSQIPDGGGPYADKNISDDQFACLTELYLAIYQAEGKSADAFNGAYSEIRQKLLAHPYMNPSTLTSNSFDWMNTRVMSYMSLVVADNELPAANMDGIKTALKNRGTTAAYATDGTSNKTSDLDPLASSVGKTWGSNSNLLNSGILSAYSGALNRQAGNTSSAISAFEGSLRTLDYVLGENPLVMSFITGYGGDAETDTHDRWAWTLFKKNKTPYPAGWLAGGPTGDALGCFAGTENRINDPRRPYETATPFYYKEGKWNAFGDSTYGNYDPYNLKSGTLLTVDGLFDLFANGLTEVSSRALALSTFQSTSVPSSIGGWTISKNQDMNYAARGTAPDAWCSKENTINYNSSLLWMALMAPTIGSYTK